MSLSAPAPSSSTPRARAYPSTTHCSALNEVLRSVAICGSATFTMVTSMSSMKVPRHTVTSGHHLPMAYFLSFLRGSCLPLHDRAGGADSPSHRSETAPFCHGGLVTDGIRQAGHASA